MTAAVLSEKDKEGRAGAEERTEQKERAFCLLVTAKWWDHPFERP